jgi:gas vesicle protein
MDLSSMTKDDILHALGLQERRTTADAMMPALALLASGVLVGAGLALLFAPKPGTEVRRDIARTAGELKGRIPEVRREITRAAEDLRERLPVGHKDESGETS